MADSQLASPVDAEFLPSVTASCQGGLMTIKVETKQAFQGNIFITATHALFIYKQYPFRMYILFFGAGELPSQNTQLPKEFVINKFYIDCWTRKANLTVDKVHFKKNSSSLRFFRFEMLCSNDKYSMLVQRTRAYAKDSSCGNESRVAKAKNKR